MDAERAGVALQKQPKLASRQANPPSVLRRLADGRRTT